MSFPFLRQYLDAIWKDWLARMTSIAGLVFLVLALVFRLTEAAQARYWIGAAVICYVVAAYRVWRKEHLRANELSAANDCLNKELEEVNGESNRAIPLTPEDLTAAYKGRTSIQGQKLSAAHVGKPLTYSGVIQDIDEYGSRFCVQLRGEGRSVPVYAYFEKNWHEPLSALTKGDNITIRGKISGVAPSTVFLEDSELVKF